MTHLMQAIGHQLAAAVVPPVTFVWQHPEILTAALTVAMAAGVATVYLKVRRDRRSR